MGLWMENGRLMADGSPEEVVDAYVNYTGGGSDEE